MRRAAKSASRQKWLFIRFRDPDFHLRVRIFARPIDLRQRIIPSVENWVRPLLEEGILHGFRVEPYEREIERYGGLTGVSLLEEISAADSAANLKLMQIPEVLKNKVFRSMIGVISAHGLLVSLGLESQARQIADAFASSGAAESTDLIRKTRSSELAHAYREYRQPTISAVVMLSRQSHKDWIIGGLTPQLEKALAILRIRDSSIRIAVKKRRGLSHLTVSDFDFAGSVIHMCLNRLIPDSSFATDLSIFEVLRKIYRELSIRRSDIQK